LEAHALSFTAMEAMRACRADYAAALAELGFVSEEYVRRVRSDAPWRPEAAPDAHSASLRVLKAALTAGLYPHVLRVKHPEQAFAPTHSGAVPKENAPSAVRFFDRDAGRVFLHPSSVNFGCARFEQPWLVYSEAVQTQRVYIRECTMVPPYALLLFGGDVDVRHEQGALTVDGWAAFEAPARVAVLVRELRAGVDRLLSAKVADPGLHIAGSPAVTALLALLQSDGM